MTVFADSSALVKLYADEPGHERIREVSILVVSQLARVEGPPRRGASSASGDWTQTPHVC